MIRERFAVLLDTEDSIVGVMLLVEDFSGVLTSDINIPVMDKPIASFNPEPRMPTYTIRRFGFVSEAEGVMFSEQALFFYKEGVKSNINPFTAITEA